MSWLFPCASRRTQKQTTATPILDLQEPLPKPADEITTGRLLFALLTFTAVVVINGNYTFLGVLISALWLFLLSGIVHEFGHLSAGWCAGLRFAGLHIGPFAIRRYRGKWALKLRPRVYQSEAHMVLGRIRRIRRSLTIFTMGGPVASYAVGLTAFVGAEIYRVNHDLPWPAWLGTLGFFSLFEEFMSTFRMARTGGNDAFLLRSMLLSKQDSRQMIASHGLQYVVLVKSVTPPCYERWWRVASTDPSSLRTSLRARLGLVSRL